MNELVHWNCVAHGRVQGVNYRARVAEAAHRHDIVGSVANRVDGTVFIDVQGDLGAVEVFLRDVSGPRGTSHAHSVQRVAEVVVDPGMIAFEILRERRRGSFPSLRRFASFCGWRVGLGWRPAAGAKP